MYVTLYTAVPNVSHLQIIFPTNNIQYVCHTIYRSTKCQPLTDNISRKHYRVCMSHYIPQYQMSATSDNISHTQYTVCMSHYIPQYQMSATSDNISHTQYTVCMSHYIPQYQMSGTY